MKLGWWTDTSRSNWVDFLLSWVASALAAYSCGQAVISDSVSVISVGFVTIGALISFLMASLFRGKKILKIDGPIYCLVTWVAIIGVRKLTLSTFGPDTFPPELMPSSWLLWMIIFGSFFVWRDGTLLFHAIPALAMFGFVGCYDTFSGVVWLFFAFLLCFAMLFARAHARDMQKRAVESGYFRETKQEQLNAEDQSIALRSGPWRWAAGAEWALGSALLIVLLSILGAPVVQATAKPISGFVAVRAPRLANRLANRQNATSADALKETSVGNGPVSLRDIPLFEIRGSVPGLLRIATYSTWGGHSWTKTWTQNELVYDKVTRDLVRTSTASDSVNFYENRSAGYSAEAKNTEPATVTALDTTAEIPQSGNYALVDTTRQVLYDAVGTASLAVPEKYTFSVRLPSVNISNAKNSPREVSGLLLQALDNRRTPLKVRELAAEVTKGLATDIEKAQAITKAVSDRIRYNTRVSAVPADKDPSEVALFETKEGYCDVFATSVVNMARSVKIPARYTIGYAVDPSQVSSMGTQYLLESDRHAWAELFFEGVGWVAFDATSGADVVEGGGRRENTPSELDFKTILVWTLNLLIVAALGVGCWFYFRSRKEISHTDRLRSELDELYVMFTSELRRRTGKRRLLSETTAEYVIRLEPQLAGFAGESKDLGNLFTTLMFSQDELTKPVIDGVRRRVKDFVIQLKSLPKAK